ncbi:YiiD C-terminal domain-containing protein [Luteimonas deserti]|uniref:YiiD C-terminal domain-containing protein n=1 Tax=Luteimonas deserti TaxID=2752306 RepID=A0A7Z0TYP2_9GAMM|nr:YiiD C-terminal domain-containing protein [Luteimonas deserti]NYZ61358.1 YiiD C-terminal domain-containing protein [Luteimonas deserti]
MTDDPLTALEAHYRSMPPVAAMQIRIAGFDGDHLHLQAPLATHVNDKGTAFGGSLTSLMTLAAWGLTTLQVEAAGLDAEVYVADSDVRYLAPLRGDLEARAELAGGDWEAFLRTLRQRGRARVSLTAQVALPEGGVAAEMQARYVAILRPSAAA